MTRSERSLLTCGARVDARDRFEGEYPPKIWHRGRTAEALHTGYAPSKYPTKQWPTEALLEVWCSRQWEAPDCFEFGALILDRSTSELAATWTFGTPDKRSRRPATTVAMNANEPPGVHGEGVGDTDGYALDAAFPGNLRDTNGKSRV